MDAKNTHNYATQAIEGSHSLVDTSSTAPTKVLGPGMLLKNRYLIEKQLGSGGFAIVYLGRDQQLLSKRVVIKFLLEDLTQSAWSKKKFQQEIEALSRIDHPGVVGVLDAGELLNGKPYLVMQFVEGHNLRSAIASQRMELKRVAKIIQQVGRAISAAHDKGVYHRDLKPENIMLQDLGEGEEQIKVIDFGIATVKDSRVATSRSTTAVAGTVSYMAPEQLMGKPSPASDVYAMGVMAYEMLTGQQPYNPDSPYQLLEMQRAGLKVRPKDLRSDLSGAAQEVILKALSFYERDRYSRPCDFGRELARALTSDEDENEIRAGVSVIEPESLLPSSTILVNDSSRLNNLPVQPTRLIGRETELTTLEGLLRQEDLRLVTLTGAGGTGKTRLAIQAAENLLNQFANGVCFVSLAAISDPILVVGEIGRTLGIKEMGNTPITQLLEAHLRDRQMLLLIDNFEQVASAAPLVLNLIARSPQLKVLITSRAPLHIRGEQEFNVPPLAVPELNHLPSPEEVGRYPSVALFVERAMSRNQNFAVSNENAQIISEICIRLDGLPLAIELAAARTKLLSLPELLARLESRLSVLTNGAQDLPTRQQTMRSTISWSYELLTEDQKALFRRLAVFVGGFTLETSEAFCSQTGDVKLDVLDGLSSLVDKSLLQHKEEKGNSRFVMLETLREFGFECIAATGEAEALQHAHLLFFLRFAEKTEPALKGPSQAMWLDQLDNEHDNLRAALNWAKEIGQVDKGLQLAAALVRFWGVRGYLSEGRAALEELLSRADMEVLRSTVRVKALNAIGILARHQADYTCAVLHLKEALALSRELGDTQGSGLSLNFLGLVAYDQGDYSRAASLLEESLALCRESGDQLGTALALNHLAVVAQHTGDYENALLFQQQSVAIRRILGDKLAIASSLNNLGLLALDRCDYEQAERLFSESLSLFREIGDKLGIATSLNNLGEMAQFQAQYERALKLYEQSLTLFKEIGDKRDIAALLNNLGEVARYRGNYERARELYIESLSLRREVGEKLSIASCLEGLAGVACALGHAEQAARLFGMAAALRERLGGPMSPVRRTDYVCNVDKVRAALGEDIFAKRMAEGKTIVIEQAWTIISD